MPYAGRITPIYGKSKYPPKCCLPGRFAAGNAYCSQHHFCPKTTMGTLKIPHIGKKA
jgi:hypothetical protein